MSREDGENSDLTQIADYRVVRKIGEGGMGRVYQAQAPDGVDVAVKVRKSDTVVLSLDDTARFRRESDILDQLTHPNIVSILGRGVDNGRDFLVMEFVDGESLRERIQKRPGLAISDVRPIVAAIVEALSYLHENGIVHRDLKPDNILLGEDNSVRLTDFGIAVPVRDIGAMTSTGEVFGSLDYMSPEQRHRLPLDQRADQYSLAAIIYELLTNKLPLGNFKPPSEVNGRITAEVDAILLRALKEDSDDRYATIREFGEALDVALLQASRGPNRIPVYAFAACLVILLALAISGNWSGNGAISNSTAAVPNPPLELENSESSTNAKSPQTSRTKDVAYFREIAESNLEAGRLDKAIDCYTQAITLEPKNTKLLTERAAVYFQSNLLPLAIDDLKLALDIDPKLSDARVRLGQIYSQTGDYQGAIDCLNVELQRDPNCALALAFRGWSHYRLGKLIPI